MYISLHLFKKIITYLCDQRIAYVSGIVLVATSEPILWIFYKTLYENYAVTCFAL
jgi:hypothetical protein